MDTALQTLDESLSAPSCTTGTPSKTAFLWTIFTVAIIWWIWPIISNFSKGYRTILKAISWNCARACQPGSTGYFAIRASRTPEERLVLFFNGMPIHGAEEGQMKLSGKMTLFYLLCQVLTITPFIIGVINKFYICGAKDAENEKTRRYAASSLQLWYFPTLPGAIIGFWLALDAKFFRCTRHWSFAICSLLVILGGAALLAACVKATNRTTNKFQGVSASPVIAYFMLCFWGGADSIAMPFVCLWSVISRNVPIALVAFSLSYYRYPWKSLEHPVFGVWFLIMGVICAGFSGYGLAMKGGPAKRLREIKRAELTARANNSLVVRETNASSTEEVAVAAECELIPRTEGRGVLEA